MRLADFIAEHPDLILSRWPPLTRDTARHDLSGASGAAPDHPADMLKTISATMRTVQAGGTAPATESGVHSPAALHGAERLLSGVSIEELVAEFPALRASVLQAWIDQGWRADTDMDDVMRLDQAIDQSQAEAVEHYAAMIKHAQHLFLAILGHDLRNPLNTTVVAASFLMRAPGIAPGHAEVAARIHRSGVRMGGLIEDLIDYTRTHLGCALPMALTKCNMGTICRGTVEELRLTNPQRSIQFEQGSDLDGVWDEGRMAQVFSNLLGNAVQHGDDKTPIHLRVESGGNEIVIRIHNTGKPIAPQALAGIFDPLVRFAGPRAATSGIDSSLGIGLFIARAIVKAHGGDIQVVSDERNGTTFSVHLPRVPPRVPAP